MKRIALSGYYGFGNAGDEAVLAGLIRSLRESSGDIAFTVLSIDPAGTERDHNVPAAHRYKAAPLVRAIARCDLLASGGGSLLQDVTSRHSIFYYLGVVRAAQILGKKTMFIAQGIGPLTLARSRRLTASVARRCDAISVRDKDSAALLASIGVTRPPIEVTADPALLLDADSPEARTKCGAAGVSLRPWPEAPAGFPSLLARACSDVIGAAPMASVVMSPDDLPLHSDFLAALGMEAAGGNRAMTWSEASCALASCEIVVAMRLHALILAAANAVPSVALSYDPKVAAFMQQTGQEDALFDIRNADASKLATLIGRVWQDRANRAENLRAQLPLLRASAARNADIAISLVGS